MTAPREEFEAALELALQLRFRSLMYPSEEMHNAAIEAQRKVVLAHASAIERAERAEGDLRHLDEVLARRPALASEDGRLNKVLKAIRVAGESDALKAECERDAVAVRELHHELGCKREAETVGGWIGCIRDTFSELMAERDALRRALESVWAAIGDALCSGNGIEKEYAWAVQREIKAALAGKDTP